MISLARVARLGGATTAPTDGSVLGRKAVGIDDSDESGSRVEGVTSELPGGPGPFDLTPG